MSFRESLLYSHIAGVSGPTAIKSQMGVLHTVTINTTGAAPGTITIADGSTTIAVITPVASTSPFSLIFDVRFNNNLTVTTTGANIDLTLAYE